MKNRKTLFLFVLAGILSCSGVFTASADSIVDSGRLKSGLLLSEKDNPQYNIYDYNTNDDNTVNVLDLCRAKKNALETHMKQTQKVKLSCTRPWITEDKSMFTVPVSISGNTQGVSALSFYVSYDTWKFKLQNVYSTAGNVSFSQSSDYVQFSSKDGSNLTAEGDILYLEFSVYSDVPYDKYKFFLDEIQATMSENGSQRELKEEECPYTSDVLSFTFSRTIQVPGVTATVTSPVTTVITTPETTASSVSTTMVTPPPAKNDKMTFSMNDAELSADGRRLRVPVYMNENTTGIFSVNMIVKYDRNKFNLSGVSQGNYNGYGYIGGNKDNAVFSTYNNQNIAERSGVIAYLEFEVNGNADSGTYQFELTDIKAYYSENWNPKEIQKDKYSDRSAVYNYSFSGSEAATTTAAPWIPPVITTTTTPWTPPVTTTTTTPWTPPVTTTTTTPWTPPETSQPDFSSDVEDIEIQVAELVNDDRERNSMSRLVLNDALCAAADKRALELAESWSLDRPNGEGMYSLFKECGANVVNHSLVYAAKSTTASAVFSTVQRTKLSSFDNSNFNSIGVGHAYVPGSVYGHYWVVFVAKM